MKSTLLNKIFGYLMLAVLAMGVFSSCDDDVNDWGTDPSHDRLFRPLLFDRLLLNATDVSISFTKILGAEKYVFEFSDDSLKFSNIVRTVEVLADTLTPFASSDVPSKVLFLKKFEDFDAETIYSVRMRGVDSKKNLASEYVEFYFKTPAENIMLTPEVSAEDATLRWTPTDRVTHIEVFNVATGESVIADGTLTEEEKASGRKYLSGLKMGTIYAAEIYNGERLRGKIQFKTNGMAGSEAYEVQAGDDLFAILTDFVASEIYNVTLIFEQESVHELITLDIPAGIQSLTFTAPSTGIRPRLNLNKISNLAIMDGLYFENINLNGGSYESNRFIDTKTEIQHIRFDGCLLANYNCIVRLQNAEMTVKKVEMNNCMIIRTGGYGIFNVGGANVSFDDLVVSNCTFVEMGTQLLDIRTAIGSVNVSNCTFYNHDLVLKQLFRFDKNNLPVSVQISDCILSGDNGGGKASSVYGGYIEVSFAGTYRTAELQEDRYPFADITEYKGTAYDLFEDPDNYRFYIKGNAGFAGYGKAGDSRWFR